MWKHSQVFAVTLGPKHLQVFEAVPELEARLYSLVAVVESLKRMVAS